MKKILSNYAFIIILIIQAVIISFVFGKYKECYHSDEIFTYGFSNSYKTKDIYIDDNGNNLCQKWTDSQELLDYISVDKEHRFDFVTAYQHARRDLNPPFHLFLVHAVSSFFPGVFSKWFAYSINILSFLVIQVFLYMLMMEITESKLISLSAVVLYGFSAGCFNTVEFLRMYALGTAFAMVFFYCSYKYIKCEDKKKSVHYLGLCFLNLFLGAFTLHLFLVYAFPVVAILCFALLFKKKIKKMFLYGFTELFAVGASMLVFPKLIQDTAGSTDSFSYGIQKYSDAFQFRIYSFIITHDLFGIHFDMYSNPWIKNSIAILIFIIIAVSPFAFMSRKEEWLKNIFRKIKNYFISLGKELKDSYFIILASFVTVLFTIIIASKRTSVYSMTIDYTSRYIFMVYPFLVIALVLAAYYIFGNMLKKRKPIMIIILVLASIFPLLSQLGTNHSYLFVLPEQGVTFKDLEEDSNCVLVLKDNWQIVNFCSDIYNTGSYYYTNIHFYDNDPEFLDEIDKSKPLYILVDASALLTDADIEYLASPDCDPVYVASKKDAIAEKEVTDYYNNLSDVDYLELVGSDMNFTGLIHIYRVHYN